ncbi:unnamed protein product, partial [marine sediment metagenome]
GLPSAWFPIAPVTATADGNGNPEAGGGLEIVAASVGDRIDVMLWMGVDTVSAAGQYEMNFREATAAPAVCIPDYTAVIVPSAARGHHPPNPYGFRIITVNDNLNFGIADGQNADWPNDALVFFTGFYRYI